MTSWGSPTTSRDSPEAAFRFAPAVEATIRGLAAMPGKGSLKFPDHPRLADVRSWAVDGSPNHLILSLREADASIWVLSVTHGARQLPGMLLRRL